MIGEPTGNRKDLLRNNFVNHSCHHVSAYSQKDPCDGKKNEIKQMFFFLKPIGEEKYGG